MNEQEQPSNMKTHRSLFDSSDYPLQKHIKNKIGESIQPWKEDPQANPFILFKSQSNGKVTKSKRIVYMQPKFIVKMNQKPLKSRQSKQLPVMDIGGLNTIRKHNALGNWSQKKFDLQKSNSKSNSVVTRKSSMHALPSVFRQLDIQRKIYLMKTQSNTSERKKSKKNYLNFQKI